MGTPKSPTYSPCSPTYSPKSPARSEDDSSSPPVPCGGVSPIVAAVPRKAETDPENTAPVVEPLDEETLSVGATTSIVPPPVVSPSVPLTLRHRVAMLQCVADRWVLHQAQLMVARGTKERTYRVMKGVCKRYKEAKAKLVAIDQQARVKSAAKLSSESE